MNMTVLLINGVARDDFLAASGCLDHHSSHHPRPEGIRLQHVRYEPHESGAVTTATLGNMKTVVLIKG